MYRVSSQLPDFLGLHRCAIDGNHDIRYLEDVHSRSPMPIVCLTSRPLIGTLAAYTVSPFNWVTSLTTHDWILDCDFFDCTRNPADSLVFPDAQLM